MGLPEAFAQIKEVKMSEKKRILVVDDEPDFAAIVQENLEKEGFAVEVAYCSNRGHLSAFTILLLLTDSRFENSSVLKF